MMYSGPTGYWKNGFNMFYGNDLVSGADPITLKDLGEGWGENEIEKKKGEFVLE